MNPKKSTPKDAAAVILLNTEQTEVLWARRNPKLKFLGGFHGFPGGKVDKDDANVEVGNCQDKQQAELLACAVRETFEEIGVLLVRGGGKLTTGQRKSLHDDLISGRSTFAEILELWGLWIDAADFYYTGFWTTPEFSPLRFKTRFFMAVCPAKQKPYQAIDEMQEIEFIKAERAVKMWAKSKVLIAPPVLISLQELAESRNDVQQSAKNLLEESQDSNGNIDYIELNSRLICLPLRTKTLPPATHTNCFIVGKKEFVVIDSATGEKGELEKLFAVVDKLISDGGICSEIVVSHFHQDHFGGEVALQKYLSEKYQQEVFISAHPETFSSLGEYADDNFEKTIDDESIFTLYDADDKQFDLQVMHTPGHARGHLCFYDEKFGFLLSSDNIVGQGTVVIAPPEGNMIDYLSSLERMKNLPDLNFLCGSHGAAVFDAKGKIEEYIEHRLEREKQILQVFETGIVDSNKIVEKVYQNLDPRLIPLAEKSVEAHLEKLEAENKISLSAQN